MQRRLDRKPDAMTIRRSTVEHVFGTLKHADVHPEVNAFAVHKDLLVLRRTGTFRSPEHFARSSAAL
jgi:hypothetical protein